jgi:hypothetical protein
MPIRPDPDPQQCSQCPLAPLLESIGEHLTAVQGEKVGERGGGGEPFFVVVGVGTGRETTGAK